MLVGIAGLANSGKDTVADILVRRFSFVRVALADPMKRACREWFGWPADTLWGPSEMRNQTWDRLGGLSARKALQQLGTEFGRACYENVWVDYAIRTAEELLSTQCKYDPVEGLTREPGPIQKRVRPLGGVVISDIRFPNELEAIHAAGGRVWKIVRPGAGLVGEAASHASENALDGYDSKFDAIIFNDGTLGELEDGVCGIVRVTL